MMLTGIRRALNELFSSSNTEDDSLSVNPALNVLAVDPRTSGKTADWPKTGAIDFGTSGLTILIKEEGGSWRVVSVLQDMKGQPAILSAKVFFASNGDVFIGNEAVKKRNEKADGEYHTSLKRWIDFETREPRTTQELLLMRQKVTAYLLAAMGESKSKLAGMTQVVVCVPNAFNRSAISVVRGGVLDAIRQAAPTLFEFPIDRVYIVREAVAVAALPLPLSSSVAFCIDGLEARWESLLSRRHNDKASEWVTVLVLDGGSGSTDLTVVRVRLTDFLAEVRLSAGVPIGGTDADLVLATAAVDKTRDLIDCRAGEVPNLPWTLLLTHAERAKCEGWGVTSDPSTLLAHDLFYQFIGSSVTGKPGTPLAKSPDVQARERAGRGLSDYVEVSVTRLLALVPSDWPIDVVLLTGRGSLLAAVQEAVRGYVNNPDHKNYLGTSVYTLNGDYRKWAAVAGCMALATPAGLQDLAVPAHSIGLHLACFVDSKISTLVETHTDVGARDALFSVCPHAGRGVVNYLFFQSAVALTGGNWKVSPNQLIAAGVGEKLDDGRQEGPIRRLALYDATEARFRFLTGAGPQARAARSRSAVHFLTDLPVEYHLTDPVEFPRG